MREIGIDVSAAKPQRLTKRVDWHIADPKGQPLEQVRAIRDEIHERVKALLRTECADCMVRVNG